MTQSPGDSNSRGFNFATNNYTKNPFPRETIKARALTSWGLCHLLWPSCAQGATCSRAMVVLRVTAGARPCATLTPRTLLEAFPRLWLVCSLQQKRTMCSRVPTFIVPQAHVMPSTWRLPHWLPRGWRQPRGDLAGIINASARAPS